MSTVAGSHPYHHPNQRTHRPGDTLGPGDTPDLRPGDPVTPGVCAPPQERVERRVAITCQPEMTGACPTTPSHTGLRDSGGDGPHSVVTDLDPGIAEMDWEDDDWLPELTALSRHQPPRSGSHLQRSATNVSESKGPSLQGSGRSQTLIVNTGTHRALRASGKEMGPPGFIPASILKTSTKCVYPPQPSLNHPHPSMEYTHNHSSPRPVGTRPALHRTTLSQPSYKPPTTGSRPVYRPATPGPTTRPIHRPRAGPVHRHGWRPPATPGRGKFDPTIVEKRNYESGEYGEDRDVAFYTTEHSSGCVVSSNTPSAIGTASHSTSVVDIDMRPARNITTPVTRATAPVNHSIENGERMEDRPPAAPSSNTGSVGKYTNCTPPKLQTPNVIT